MYIMSICTAYIFATCFGVAVGFMCYSCSYTYTDGNKGIECLNNPDALKQFERVKCGNHCITSEQWDTQHRRINSFFRGCSPNIGNKCTPDVWHINCVTSCRGEYCNRDLFVDAKNPPTVTDCHKFYGCNGLKSQTSLYYPLLWLSALVSIKLY